MLAFVLEGIIQFLEDGVSVCVCVCFTAACLIDVLRFGAELQLTDVTLPPR